MKRLVLFACFGLLAGLVVIAGDSPVIAQEPQPVIIRIDARIDDGSAEDGENCPIAWVIPGSADPMTDLPLQLLVSDQSSDIIAVADLDRGTWDTSERTAHCIFEVTLNMPASTFYTFTVANLFTYTVSSETLESQDRVFEVDLLD